MSEQVGGIGKSLQKALFGVAIVYVVAIGLTFLLILISQAFTFIFPTVPNPFPMIYNVVRSLTLFILVFPFALGLVGGAFVIDLVTSILFPILNSVAPDIFPISEGTDFMTTAITVVTTIQGFIESLFPPLS